MDKPRRRGASADAEVAERLIAYLPDFSVREPLADGRLRVVLEDEVGRAGVFHMLWPASKHPSPKVRALVDFLCARVFPAPAA